MDKRLLSFILAAAAFAALVSVAFAVIIRSNNASQKPKIQSGNSIKIKGEAY